MYILIVKLFSLDAAEVVLFRCINRIQNDKGVVTAIETSFEFLDDFQDPVKGGIYGCINKFFVNSNVQDEETQQLTDSRWDRKFPTSPVKFDKHNHILQWMVTSVLYCVAQFYGYPFRSNMSELDCFNILLLVN